MNFFFFLLVCKIKDFFFLSPKPSLTPLSALSAAITFFIVSFFQAWLKTLQNLEACGVGWTPSVNFSYCFKVRTPEKESWVLKNCIMYMF